MRRFLRLLTLCLLALTLPLQGAAAATGMADHAGASTPSQTMMMVMPDGATMDSAAMALPCHPHGALDKNVCGACCGPLLTQQALLAVAPVAMRWAVTPRAAARAATPVFLTGGTDRPPRILLA